MMLSFISVIFSLVESRIIAPGIEECIDHPVLEISRLSVVPRRPEIGNNLTIVAKGNLTTEVHRLTCHVKAKYGIVPFPTVTINLCDYPQYITCPHKTGTMDFKESFEIPRIVPSGHYSASVDCFMGSETKKKALCYRLSMEFVNSTPFSRFIDSIFPE